MVRAYFNESAARWDEASSETDGAKLATMASRLAIAPGALVLDVGAGTGRFLPFLLKSVGAGGRVVALDFAEEMLQQARRKDLGGDISYVCADVGSIPLRDGVFDAVVCYSSLPHFPDKPRALAEMGRVLKPGGRLYVCHTSGRESINGIHRRIPAVAGDLLPDECEMRRLLEAAGFVDVTVDDGGESYLASASKPG